ncbi:helicase-related protein [Microbacterium sp. LWS13-1.2]|uniref:DEAD/DEAH box helicase n=1 Tax=Microbacterium sp. LWS13-1.2 TaxID=3135264 RepID=A0AAU6SFJ3_9MICO
MTSSKHDLDPVGPTFGYHPDSNGLDLPLARGRFDRALILDTAVRGVADEVSNCRVLWRADPPLPEGVYWFEGLDDGNLVVQVGIGKAPADSSVVELADLADDDPLANAWEWAESLWTSAIEVPAPIFAVNEAAITHPSGADVVVRARKFLRDSWSYSVVIDGRPQDVVESRLRPVPAHDDPTTWVLEPPTDAASFGATLTRAKLRGKFADTLFSFRATRTTFRPYQFKPVLKLLQTGKARLLIADEVGLGKTIEAGLIWTELEARTEADRVLIVCPSNLLSKWKEEMEDRFGFELVELDNQSLDQFLNRHLENRLPPRLSYICSIERLRRWSGLEQLEDLPPEFDLVIVDEAHSMRNPTTKNYSLGTELADWADNLVFLTATPINLGEGDLLSLLELLAPEDFGSIWDLNLRLEPNAVINTAAADLVRPGAGGREVLRTLERLERSTFGASIMRRPEFELLTELLSKPSLDASDVIHAKRYLADLNTLSAVITRTKKVEVDERKAKRTEDRHDVEWTAAEFEFYEQYVEWCKARAREMDSNLYFSMQMPLRLASACLPMARQAVLDPEHFGTVTDEDDDHAVGRVAPHAALVAAARRLGDTVDTKFDELRASLRNLKLQNRRALLFTFSRPTLAYLESRLKNEFRIGVMHGGVSRDQRRTIMSEFRAGAFDFVFANRVASEGLDFEFCSAVINYDLPWNPMEIEQRIGRIDRIGQPEDTMLIVNFVNDRTIDERILARLLTRIKIFESSIGALEPIIAAAAPEVLKAGFDFTLDDAQRAQKVHEALLALEEQRAGLKDVADAASSLLVSNDVDVAGLEDDLLRSGRYLGQRELALLVDHWARVDGAQGIRFARDGLTVELRGNSAMAARVDELNKRSQRTRAETAAFSSQLRNEVPIHLVLDQELARKTGGVLLNATSPLAMAAAEVPSHRQARFASLRVESPSIDSDAVFVVVLAKAVAASRGGDEIWGAAVGLDGRPANNSAADAVLAALAQGQLADHPFTEVERLPHIAQRALDELALRHADEQDRRDREFDALLEARRITLTDQHQRRLLTIEKRIETARINKRGPKAMKLFDGQRRRAESRFARLTNELANERQPEILLEPLAACVVKLVPEGAR